MECHENIDIADRIIRESSLPEKFNIENWRNVCIDCKQHDQY